MRKMLFLSGSLLLLLLPGCVYPHIHICRAMLEKEEEEEERQAAAAREKLDNTGEHREREGRSLLPLIRRSSPSPPVICKQKLSLMCVYIDRLQSI
jgi:hypothetical protein